MSHTPKLLTCNVSIAGLTLLFGLLVPLHAAHASESGRGSNVFEEQCAECHSAKPGKNKKGPSLYGVVGRTVGGIADYAYSDAMKSFSATWTQEKLDAYLAYPRKVVPGTKMKYDGLADSNARGELIQFLSSIN